MIVRVADERLPEGEVVMPGIVLRIVETPGTLRIVEVKWVPLTMRYITVS